MSGLTMGSTDSASRTELPMPESAYSLKAVGEVVSNFTET